MLLSPKLLAYHSIPVSTGIQREGEIIITFPHGYHSGMKLKSIINIIGFNYGQNVAESINFANESWVKYGREVTNYHLIKNFKG